MQDLGVSFHKLHFKFQFLEFSGTGLKKNSVDTIGGALCLFRKANCERNRDSQTAKANFETVNKTANSELLLS